MSPQQSIAHYRIVCKLGEGGMGAVYRASDTKLNRDVAIKVLPEALSQDAGRMQRFEREAHVLASLNHPNIAAIYGVEEGAIVMELVEGEELKGPVPVDVAIGYAKQLAAALEAAHEKGIVHRDLKPANIKITPEGVLKVLDFGLAKAAEESPASGAASPTISPTMSLQMTQAGLILGTAAYMSPEQARGKPVDRRADIWAFGVVVYEMLTGAMLFAGETVSDSMISVATKEPDWSALPKDTPAHVRKLLARCMRKDPRMRLRDIGEARVALEEPEAAGVEVPAANVPAAVPAPAATTGWKVGATMAVVAALALGALLWRATRPISRPLERFSADLGPDAVVGTHMTAAISPDGSRITFPVRTAGGGWALATRLMSSSTATVLSGTDNGFDAFFSPDGQWIAFFDGSKLKKVSMQGGATVTLCDAPVARGAVWGEDGFIYGSFDGLHLARVPAAGGTRQILTEPEKRGGVRTDRWPQILPGGEFILMTVGLAATSGGYEDASIGVYSIKNGQVKIVQRGGYCGRYVPSGHLLYIHQGTMFGVPFDLKRLETRGMPAPVLEDVAGNVAQAGGQFDFANNGTLVYLSGTSASGTAPILWMDQTGKKQPLMAAPGMHPLTPRLSPDGKLLAYSMGGDIYIYDPARNATSRITFDPGANATWPVWTPDGKHIAYSPSGNGIWWVRSDGSGKPAVLYDSKTSAVPTSISPDGKVLAFHEIGKNRDIYTARLDLTDPDHPKFGPKELFLATDGADVEATFSPDGRWLAYSSNGPGRYEVFVRPFPEGAQGAGQAQISSGSGRFPIWSRTSKEIFYVASSGHIMAAPYVVNGRAFLPGKPVEWSDSAIGTTGVNIPLDLAPGGKRFVVFPGQEISGGGEKANLHVTFLLNFFDELKRRMP